jgi:hypothetical protein
MNQAAINAVRERLGYLEDNRYRYVKMGGYSETHPTVLSYDEEILQLKKALQEAGASR